MKTVPYEVLDKDDLLNIKEFSEIYIFLSYSVLWYVMLLILVWQFVWTNGCILKVI